MGYTTGKRWTSEDLVLLVKLRNQKLKWKEIASTLGTTVSACKSRLKKAAKLGNPIMEGYNNYSRVWTDEEVQNLWNLKNEGKSIPEIAKMFGRTVSSVESKATKCNMLISHRWTLEEREVIGDLYYKKGLSNQQISDQLSLTLLQVKYAVAWLSKHTDSTRVIYCRDCSQPKTELQGTIHKLCGDCISNYKRYRSGARFRFKVSDYSHLHVGQDTTLDKDHKYSCYEGYMNSVPSFILKHPANCEFLSKSSNSSKGVDCSLTYTDLKNKILDSEKVRPYFTVAEMELFNNFSYS